MSKTNTPPTAASRRRVPLVLLGMVAVAAIGLDSAPAEATSVYNATSLTYGWPTNSGGNCSLSTIFSPGVDNWRSAVATRTVVLSPNDWTIFWSELTDTSVGGQDNIDNNVDSNDLAIVATHGGIMGTNENPTGVALAETTNAGDNNGNCLASSHQMLVGNSQTEFLDIWGCYSVPKRLIDNFYWSSRTTRLHQLHGFHGTSASGSGTTDTLDDYIDDAFDGTASVAWVVNQTSWDHWGGTSDVCGIAMANGNDAADGSNRLWNERYDAGTNFSDPTNQSVQYTYMCDCEPPDGLTGELSC